MVIKFGWQREFIILRKNLMRIDLEGQIIGKLENKIGEGIKLSNSHVLLKAPCVTLDSSVLIEAGASLTILPFGCDPY